MSHRRNSSGTLGPGGSRSRSWIKLFDHRSMRSYWHNTVTGRSQWEAPERRGSTLKGRRSSLGEELPAQQPKKNSALGVGGDSLLMAAKQMSGGSREQVLASFNDRRNWGRPRTRTASSADSEEKGERVSIFRSTSSVDPHAVGHLTGFGNGQRQRKLSNADKDDDDDEEDEVLWRQPTAPEHRRARANTTNSMFVTSTMSKPDCDEQIACVAAILHGHMVRFALSGQHTRHEGRLLVFNENYGMDKEKKQGKAGAGESAGRRTPNGGIGSRTRGSGLGRVQHGKTGVKALPSRDEVERFVKRVHRKAQMESESVVMTIIYAERFLQATEGRLQMRRENWRAIVLTAMLMASKVWDDLSMWNADFALICPQFTIQRINELELAFLEATEFSVRVPASVYAKYYFQLRSLARSAAVYTKKRSQRNLLLRSRNGGDCVLSTAEESLEDAALAEEASNDETALRLEAVSTSYEAEIRRGSEAKGCERGTAGVGAHQRTESNASSDGPEVLAVQEAAVREGWTHVAASNAENHTEEDVDVFKTGGAFRRRRLHTHFEGATARVLQPSSSPIGGTSGPHMPFSPSLFCPQRMAEEEPREGLLAIYDATIAN